MKNALINLSLKIYIKLFTDKNDTIWTKCSSTDGRPYIVNYDIFLDFREQSLYRINNQFNLNSKDLKQKYNLVLGQLNIYRTMVIADIEESIFDYTIDCGNSFTYENNKHLDNMKNEIQNLKNEFEKE